MLFRFWNAIAKDPRITMRHIGLYAALLCVWRKEGAKDPLCLFSHDIMSAAKMITQSTYHQYIRQLDEYGYLKYVPSFKKNQPSKIFLLSERETQND